MGLYQNSFLSPNKNQNIMTADKFRLFLSDVICGCDSFIFVFRLLLKNVLPTAFFLPQRFKIKKQVISSGFCLNSDLIRGHQIVFTEK